MHQPRLRLPPRIRPGAPPQATHRLHRRRLGRRGWLGRRRRVGRRRRRRLRRWWRRRLGWRRRRPRSLAPPPPVSSPLLVTPPTEHAPGRVALTTSLEHAAWGVLPY